MKGNVGTKRRSMFDVGERPSSGSTVGKIIAIANQAGAGILLSVALFSSGGNMWVLSPFSLINSGPYITHMYIYISTYIITYIFMHVIPCPHMTAITSYPPTISADFKGGIGLLDNDL